MKFECKVCYDCGGLHFDSEGNCTLERCRRKIERCFFCSNEKVEKLSLEKIKNVNALKVLIDRDDDDKQYILVCCKHKESLLEEVEEIILFQGFGKHIDFEYKKGR